MTIKEFIKNKGLTNQTWDEQRLLLMEQYAKESVIEELENIVEQHTSSYTHPVNSLTDFYIDLRLRELKEECLLSNQGEDVSVHSHRPFYGEDTYTAFLQKNGPFR